MPFCHGKVLLITVVGMIMVMKMVMMMLMVMTVVIMIIVMMTMTMMTMMGKRGRCEWAVGSEDAHHWAE